MSTEILKEQVVQSARELLKANPMGVASGTIARKLGISAVQVAEAIRSLQQDKRIVVDRGLSGLWIIKHIY
jgi:predicted transcriptional regulator